MKWPQGTEVYLRILYGQINLKQTEEINNFFKTVRANNELSSIY